MNKPSSRIRPSDSFEAQAAAWLAQRDEGFTPQQASSFEAWRRADRRHAEAVARLEQAWQSLQRLGSLPSERREALARDLLRDEERGTLTVLFSRWGALTAVAAAALVFAFVLFWPKSRHADLAAASPVRVETTGEAYRRLTLDDGSAVEMNAQTELRIAYSPDERRVELLRGEASFAVAKNKARPFLVTAGTVTVRAVGTAFNVRLASTAVEVLVTEGRVKVEKQEPAKERSSAEEGPLVGAGEKIVIASTPSNESPVVTQVSPQTIRQELGWQTSWIRFDETPLSQAVEAFNSHNRIKLELADPRLGELKVDGSFRLENVEAFVRLLELNGGIATDRSVPDRIVLKQGLHSDAP